MLLLADPLKTSVDWSHGGVGRIRLSFYGDIQTDEAVALGYVNVQLSSLLKMRSVECNKVGLVPCDR